jgi:hypothetical protein
MLGEATAGRFVDAAERDGTRLAAAVWAADNNDRGRLYLVPDQPRRGRGLEGVHHRLASVLQGLLQESPAFGELMFSVVHDHFPVIDSLRGSGIGSRRLPFVVRGTYGGGTYLDRATVFRWTLD